MADQEKHGRFGSPMEQISLNLPQWAINDLNKLAEEDGLTRNTITRNWVLISLNKEKAKRGWI